MTQAYQYDNGKAPRSLSRPASFSLFVPPFLSGWACVERQRGGEGAGLRPVTWSRTSPARVRLLAPGPGSGSSSSSRHCSWTQQPGAHRVAFGARPRRALAGGRRLRSEKGTRTSAGSAEEWVTRPEAPRAPRFRPVLSPWRLAHSFLASLAPALGRYSPPLCRGNKMAAARARCARIRPPSRPLGRRRRLSRGVRAHRAPGRRLPRAGLCLLWRYARTCRQHTPPSGREHPDPRCGGDPPSHLSSSLSQSRPEFQEGRRFPRRETSPPLSLL
ncbi:hypothetical protein J1605_016836 [Eschrichtius robustus]|uniref:Uncharacterized protein n=1 Tax=Eschrichtius robustus TaxID=9764 RepID=A0AB34I0J1_ESCRO|nr:hypothetical protein J1605_016836 [Eschrichtius robustus]